MRFLVSICFGSLMLISVNAQESQRVLPFSKNWANQLAQSDQMHDRLVIKFSEQLGIRLRQENFVSTQLDDPDVQQQLRKVMTLISQFNLKVERLFTVSERVLDRFSQNVSGQLNKSVADLNGYFQLVWRNQPVDLNLAELVVALNRFEVIEVAYLEAPTVELQSALLVNDLVMPGTTPLLVQHQGYLKDAPIGVGLSGAWDTPGGTGSGIRLMVYDNNYNANHEDLPDLFVSSGVNPGVNPDHGTAVLGILGAKHNGLGLKGAVYDAEIGFQKSATVVQSHADLLFKAANYLDFGDILVIEVAKKVNALGFECPCNPTQANAVPLEFYPAEFDVISTLVASGIVVVQAAGNGCVDFDSVVFEDLYGVDHSGAFWVSAGLSDVRAPTCYANYGERVDFHAWGESVAALGFVREEEEPLFDKGLNRLYGSNFGGSSSAAPIVSACAASIQGQALTKYGEALAPAELKALLLSNAQPQIEDFDRPIGPMPDVGTLEL